MARRPVAADALDREETPPRPARTPRLSRSWIDRLQRSAGNRAVGHLLRAPEITVHKGSRLTAGRFADTLKKNKKVPDWLKKGLGSTSGSLTASTSLAAPRDRIWMFVDSFLDAFKSRGWDITTARSKIEVKQEGGKQRWRQIVTPDLAKNERIGFYMKTGPGQREFSETTLHSEDPEIIYGWTEPDTATNLREEKRGLIVIITEIDVTTADGRRKVFTPGPDETAEAIMHEIGVHAGRIAQGRPDVHSDTDSTVKDVVDQIGEFFRPSNAQGGLEPSALTKEIFAFVSGPATGAR